MEIQCKKCDCKAVKNGISPSGIQRYYCKKCSFSFQLIYKYNSYKDTINKSIKTLLKEGCGIRGIGRILEISKNTVLSRLLLISKDIKPPIFKKEGLIYEIDELWSYIRHKKEVVWLTYVLEQNSKRIIDFYIGSKSQKTIKPMIDNVLRLAPKVIYTDKLNIYPNLIPQNIHSTSRYRTNRIERMNLTLRTHVKRLAWRSICFSKSIIHFKAHMLIYFWG